MTDHNHPEIDNTATEPIPYGDLLRLLALPFHERVWCHIPRVEWRGQVYTLAYDVVPEPPEWPDGRTYYVIAGADGTLIEDTYTLLECDAWNCWAHLDAADRAGEGGES